jgi:hypothetical protein
MGIVHKARHTILDKLFALKTIRNEVLGAPGAIARFVLEARAIADLDHPNIVRIFEIGCVDRQHYFTMTYVPGGSLDKLKKELAHPRIAAALMEKIARAIQYAHDRGIIHRDLKLANVLLNEKGEPCITDFGLARVIDSPEESAAGGIEAQISGSDLTRLTRIGEIVGTPAYMSPEQAEGKQDRVTRQSDVWSLGVMLYELLTSKRPFRGKSVAEIREQVQSGSFAAPSALVRGLDRRLEAIVLKCLEKDPARRYASAAEVADDLAEWLGRRRWLKLAAMAAIAMLMVGLTAGLWYLTSHEVRGSKIDSSSAPFEDARDAELMAMHAEIAQGGPVDLLRKQDGGSPQQKEGMPRWSRSLVGPVRLAPSSGQRGVVASVFEPAVVKLLDEAPASFVFSANVQVNDAFTRGCVGLCVGLAEPDASSAREYFFCLAALSASAPAPNAQHATLDLASLRLMYFSPDEDERKIPADKQPVVARDPFRRLDIGSTKRGPNEVKLKMRVTPEGIEAWSEDRQLGRRPLTWEDLRKNARNKLLINTPGLPFGPNGPILPQPQNNPKPVAFEPIVALFVCDASAEFSDVTIQALPAQP